MHFTFSRPELVVGCGFVLLVRYKNRRIYHNSAQSKNKKYGSLRKSYIMPPAAFGVRRPVGRLFAAAATFCCRLTLYNRILYNVSGFSKRGLFAIMPRLKILISIVLQNNRLVKGVTAFISDFFDEYEKMAENKLKKSLQTRLKCPYLANIGGGIFGENGENNFGGICFATFTQHIVAFRTGCVILSVEIICWRGYN